jgi:hypothetical protein
MGKFKEMDLLRQEREAFDVDYPMEPTPRADMWIAWNSEDGFTFWKHQNQAALWSAADSNEWPVQYVRQKCTPLSSFVRSSDEDKAEVMERVIDKAIEAQKKAQPAPVQEPVESPDDWSDWKVTPPAQPAPVQEPVDWQFFDKGCWWNSDHRIKNQKKDMELAGYKTRYLYTTPPAANKPWGGLTDEERNKIRFDYLDYDERARAIEAKLKEKNRG